MAAAAAASACIPDMDCAGLVVAVLVLSTLLLAVLATNTGVLAAIFVVPVDAGVCDVVTTRGAAGRTKILSRTLYTYLQKKML